VLFLVGLEGGVTMNISSSNGLVTKPEEKWFVNDLDLPYVLGRVQVQPKGNLFHQITRMSIIVSS